MLQTITFATWLTTSECQKQTLAEVNINFFINFWYILTRTDFFIPHKAGCLSHLRYNHQHFKIIWHQTCGRKLHLVLYDSISMYTCPNIISINYYFYMHSTDFQIADNDYMH